LNNWSHSNLSAPHWRLYWNRDPGAAVALGGERRALLPDQVCLIPPETPFSTRLVRPARHFFVHFSANVRYGGGPRIFLAEVEPEFRPLLEGACQALRAGSSLEASRWLHALASRALLLPAASLFRQPRWPESVGKALACMRRRLDEPLPNPVLAREAGMATNAFIRLFRRATGETPQRRLGRIRVEKACVLLAIERLSIEEVAAACGFANRYHFSRVFKRLRGLGPAAYRRRRA